MTRRILLSICLCFLVARAWAGHIIGGEIYYEHLGGSSYLVTLDLYRDCGPGLTAFDASVQIRAFNSNGTVHATQTIAYGGETIVPVVIPNPCLTAPPNVCVATTRYQATFDLPPSPGGYTLSYQRCCRVPAILNLVQAGNQGLTCTVRVPGQPNAANASPHFANYPPIVICVGETLVFDHSAVDADGDSLAYVLCTPLTGGSVADPAPIPAAPPYQSVPWSGGYSGAYQLDSSPPMAIDPVSAQLSVSPTQQGAYAVGVCVQEYRNGVLLGTSTRDFMFTVIICDADIVAGVADQLPGAACDGLTQVFQNQSVNGQFWEWNFGDPSTLADTSSAEEPTWTYSTPGIYDVMLIANPGWPCADTSVVEYAVYLPIEPEFSTPTNLCGVSEIEFEATGNIGPAAVVDWDFGVGATPATGNGVQASAIFDTIGLQNVTVTVTDNGCTESFSSDVGVFSNPVAGIAPQDQFCSGLTFDLVNTSVGATSYRWDFGDPGTLADTSSAAEPTWTYSTPGIYDVMLIANPGWPCPDTSFVEYAVYLPIAPEFSTPANLCGVSEIEFEATGNIGPAAVVDWDFGVGATPATGNGVQASAIFDTIGLQNVTVTVTDNGCTESFSSDVGVFSIPVAGIAPQDQFCSGLTYDLINTSVGATSYRWDFGDPGTLADTSLLETPSWTYAQSGTYTVELLASGPGPCSSTATVLFDVYTNLSPNFTPPAILCPDELAEFTLEGSFTSAAEVAWDFGLAGSPQGAAGNTASSRFGDIGVHPVTVSVNENGCFGSFTDSVTVFPFPMAVLDSETGACLGSDFAFQNLSTAATPMSFVWDFGDGEQSSEFEPIHQYKEPGTYTVSLTVSTNSGCIASDMMVSVGQVEVFPLPVAAFSALPREVSVFEPNIEVEDFSIGAVSWDYTVEGNSFLSPDFSYSFLEGGQFMISLTVVTENGCYDSTTRTVFVSDHIFWAPNAFTPDGDGLNDLWSPTVIGARTYSLEIFDRWGALRFSTDDPKQGWDGEGLPASVFTYRVRIKEWGSESKEYLGHFSLLR